MPPTVCTSKGGQSAYTDGPHFTSANWFKGSVVAVLQCTWLSHPHSTDRLLAQTYKTLLLFQSVTHPPSSFQSLTSCHLSNIITRSTPTHTSYSTHDARTPRSDPPSRIGLRVAHSETIHPSHHRLWTKWSLSRRRSQDWRR